MKILLIASILRENDAISDHVLWQAMVLNEASFEVSIICTHCDSVIKNNLNSRIRLIETADPVTALAAINRSKKVIIHFGIYSPLFEVLEIIPASKILLWDHNVTPASHFNSDNKSLILKSLDQRNLLSRAEQIVADSLFTAQDWPDREVIISSPPLRQPFVDNFNSHKSRNFSNPYEFITVGRFTSSKGADELLQVLKDSSLNCVNFNVVVPRGGNDEILLKRLLKIKKKNVKVYLNLNTNELAHVYRFSKYSLSFSKHEGLGLGQIEALASGCVPIVWPGAGATAQIVPPEIGIYLSSPTAEAFRSKFLNEIKPFIERKEDGLLTEVGQIEFDFWDRQRTKVVTNYLPFVQRELLLKLLQGKRNDLSNY